VSFHSAFTYLAARYGLIQAAVFGAHVEGLGPQPLEHVINFVKEHKIKVVFAEPQFPADRLSWLAEQTGVSVGKLDPLGNPSVTGYASYLEMMRSNLKELVKALSE
jgi:zinc transport system substrate-binding protein